MKPVIKEASFEFGEQKNKKVQKYNDVFQNRKFQRR